MTRRVTAVLTLVAAALCFVPIAQAASTTTVRPTAEAWYQSDPTCGTPVGCLTTTIPIPLPDIPLSIYPARSMHVALAGGVESARSYIGLPTTGLGELASSAITIPLDTSPLSGSITPEKAKVQACLFRGPMPVAEGSLAAPPQADCASASLLYYNALPAPHLEGDLDALLPGLRGATGIVLLPDASTSQPTDAWHITFSAHDRTDAAKTAPVSITLTGAGPDAPAEGPSEQPTGAPPLPVAQPPAVGLPQVSAPEVTPAVPPAVVVAPAALPRTVTLGFAYPIVFVFPLLMLVAVPGLARLLTRDLTPTRFQT